MTCRRKISANRNNVALSFDRLPRYQVGSERDYTVFLALFVAHPCILARDLWSHGEDVVDHIWSTFVNVFAK